jgi:G:T/U-mismatch repair DNA glycosylase
MRVPVKSEKGRVYTIPSPDIVDEKNLDKKIESHNKDTTLDKNTKLLIVGTITPKHINNEEGCDKECKYFYCSSRNKMYKRIGYAIPEIANNLLDAKNENSKEKLMEILKKNNIAFLDVFDGTENNNEGPYDIDITKAVLATKTFANKKKLIEKRDLTIIVNSRLAEYYLNVILQKIGIVKNDDDNEKYIFYSQRRGTDEGWKEKIEKALDK